MKDILNQLGQLFILGYRGEKPPDSFLNFIVEENIGGVILFAENCSTPYAVRENVELIRARLRKDQPFIAIDQEGGRVCRLKGAPAEYGSAWSYGQASDPSRFREQYVRSAVFMESLGINLNLAPVCDIFTNANNKCLTERCFGTTAADVTPFVQASVETSSRAGLLSCLKHFPGLGDAAIDPHNETSVVNYDPVVWEQREKLPFVAGIEAGADMIMTTHVRYRNFDDQIATGSEKIVNSLIRQMLAFDGPVITDDLTMGGAAVLGSQGERAVAAFKAGHDILLYGQDTEAAVEAFDYFREAVERGEVSKDRLTSALSRVSGIKFKLKSTTSSSSLR